LSLNPNGSKDFNLKIQELPNITVGDYTQINKPIVIPNDNTAEEIAKGSTFKEEDEDDISTNSSNTEACFNNLDNGFDKIDRDKEEEDCNVD
jgi:hypothetical protein